MWYSGVRQALRFRGPRVALVPARQHHVAAGGGWVKQSKIADHSTVRMTEEYTKIQLTRQEELTHRIQDRLAGVGQKQTAVVQ
jgi:hypothetical protein